MKKHLHKLVFQYLFFFLLLFAFKLSIGQNLNYRNFNYVSNPKERSPGGTASLSADFVYQGVYSNHLGYSEYTYIESDTEDRSLYYIVPIDDGYWVLQVNDTNYFEIEFPYYHSSLAPDTISYIVSMDIAQLDNWVKYVNWANDCFRQFQVDSNSQSYTVNLFINDVFINDTTLNTFREWEQIEFKFYAGDFISEPINKVTLRIETDDKNINITPGHRDYGGQPAHIIVDNIGMYGDTIPFGIRTLGNNFSRPGFYTYSHFEHQYCEDRPNYYCNSWVTDDLGNTVTTPFPYVDGVDSYHGEIDIRDSYSIPNEYYDGIFTLMEPIQMAIILLTKCLLVFPLRVGKSFFAIDNFKLTRDDCDVFPVKLAIKLIMIIMAT